MLKRVVFSLNASLCVIALACPGHANAQSSVTLYGILDGGLVYTSKTLNPATGKNAGSTFGMIDSGTQASEFGLRGTEDLGGGLYANFKLESGINVANGGFNDSNGNMFGRQAWVSLDGGFGDVKAGLQFSPFFYALLASDPRGFTLFGSGVVNMVDNVLGTSVFNANAVSYTSPVFAGFQGSAMFAFGGEAGNFQAGRQYSANLSYTHGGLMLNAALYDGNAGGTVQTPVPTNVGFEGRTVGAAYSIGKLTAKISFVNYKVAGSFNNNVYGGGLDYLAMPALDINGGVWVTSDRNDTTNHSIMGAIGAQYFLSRASTLYAQVGVVNNHGAMNTGLSISDVSILREVQGTTVGVTIGMRHMF